MALEHKQMNGEERTREKQMEENHWRPQRDIAAVKIL